ncbi:exonuclease SbcCD subunit D [Anabaena sphaerica FACHB-251]|uniref:Nuclease SbcCD subunit D n=1 Tax=Anabaena sphaerica FACHB-251 TaxID=2692883 RepID=A0A927A4Q8_9NOST|nr:exonuclease SbcCD subunit D [Anabaena sphaerica]MBD2296825.1 exonuclease SbcCD subunit D [Anabaena sphaerica FACHB-251]
MRLIHTSDWHLGRNLKGKERTSEIEFALKELLVKAKELEVDAVLIAGDIFETPNPPAEAERVAYQFFQGLQAAKIPAVAIAGNHDSASRFDGIANLLSLANVHILGQPRSVKQGGLITLETPNGKLRVAAMPFASERRLLTVENLWAMDELQQISNYKERLGKCLNNLASGFHDDSVNILMAHLTIDGARLANSEKSYHTKETYALAGQSLPNAQYIALGHIHKPQRISAASPTYYCGSLIQVDFGEAGEDKGFYLIDVEPGLPAKKPEFISIPCQKPLQIVECELSNYEEKLEPYRDYSGYLKVTINLPTPPIGLADKIRKICGEKVLHIEPLYPIKNTSNQEKSGKSEDFEPVEEFKRYFQEELNTIPTPGVVAKFEELYNQIKETQDATT